MVDSPLHCDYVTITRWIALRSGLKGLVTAVAPLVTARVRSAGAAGWICVAGRVPISQNYIHHRSFIR